MSDNSYYPGTKSKIDPPQVTLFIVLDVDTIFQTEGMV
jgi:hypothetical protein